MSAIMTERVLITTVLAVSLALVYSCRHLRAENGETAVEFYQIPLDEMSEPLGRPSYRSSGDQLLFHTTNAHSGRGSWVQMSSLNLGEIAQSVDSWAIVPTEISSDRLGVMECVQNDRSVPSMLFFHSSDSKQAALSGFYVSHFVTSNEPGGCDTAVFMQLKADVNSPTMYLYALPQAQTQSCSVQDAEQGSCTTEGNAPPTTITWMIGDSIGVDAGLAYTVVPFSGDAGDGCNAAVRALRAAQDLQWHFVRSTPVTEDHEGPWVSDASAGIVWDENNTSNGIHELLQQVHNFRSIKAIPAGQNVLHLSNGLLIPQIGLGTGGIYLEEAHAVFTTALAKGYRLFDLAREYGNEHLLAEALQTSGVPRSEVFLQTKVWPTQLGFQPTLRAISTSLQQLRTGYIEHYMLHWPSCNTEIDWMHCENTEEPGATWRESYRALEKAYAEGRILSIGVSNFDLPLLQELEQSASVLPHIVQNWAEPGRTDKAVRQWCAEHGALYQPYAPLRNLRFQPPHMKDALWRIAQRYNTTEHIVVLQYFLQVGAVGIPRSSREEHLVENLKMREWKLTDEEMNLIAGEQ